MVDFTDLPVRNKTYSGANGSKISIVYNNEMYMLKFPGIPSKNNNISYANGCISEYLGCHIFGIVGIPVQETILGIYRTNNKEKIVVACKDFTEAGLVLQDFASLKNTVIDSVHNGYGTELSDILETLGNQKAIEPQILSDWFWDMFIVDALIGNWDRHNGNWGFLYNNITDEIKLAPIYDCGSSLFPQADEDMMRMVLEKKAELELRIFERPVSGIKENGKKIKYFDFISSLKNNDCNKALKRIVPRIDMEKIYKLIDDTPFISELQKKFYKTIISERKKRILDYSIKKLQIREKTQNRIR